MLKKKKKGRTRKTRSWKRKNENERQVGTMYSTRNEIPRAFKEEFKVGLKTTDR